MHRGALSRDVPEPWGGPQLLEVPSKDKKEVRHGRGVLPTLAVVSLQPGMGGEPSWYEPSHCKTILSPCCSEG